MKAILFDLDGTLLDTLDDLTESCNFALKTLGFPPRKKEEIRRFVGNGARRLIELSLPDGKGELVSSALEIFRAHYASHSGDQTRAYEGILPLMDTLKKEGYRLAIVSNKPDFAVKELARTFFSQVDFAVGEKENVRRKPAPDTVLQAMEKLSVKREESVYVGDSEVDVKTAENAGIRCIAVTWGFRDREELEEAGATRFADTPEELYDRIGEMK